MPEVKSYSIHIPNFYFHFILDTSPIHVPLQKDVLPSNTQLFRTDVEEPIELRTESRIEFIPRMSPHVENPGMKIHSYNINKLLIS